MDKIADSRELAASLQGILDYAKTPNPSRERLAQSLVKLAASVSPKTAMDDTDVLIEVQDALKEKDARKLQNVLNAFKGAYSARCLVQAMRNTGARVTDVFALLGRHPG
jgi:hypothetical protein